VVNSQKNDTKNQTTYVGTGTGDTTASVGSGMSNQTMLLIAAVVVGGILLLKD
jgi:hypothetical protein